MSYKLSMTGAQIDAALAAVSGKQDKETGKGLSTNDYTTAEKTKLAGIAEGAEVNVNADWSASSGDAQILNKPTTLAGYGVASEVSSAASTAATNACQTFLNRSNAVNVAHAGYTSLIARGESLNSSDTTPAVNGSIAWTYA